MQCLIACLLEIEAESAAGMNNATNSQAMEHRWLLLVLFRLSQTKQAVTEMADHQELTKWLLWFLDTVPKEPNERCRLAIEHATGILQNTSLKPQGCEKIVHHFKNPIQIFQTLLEGTNINCELDHDSLTLMALTNVFSIIYQLVSRKLGRNLASQAGFIDYLTDRVQLIVS